MTLRETGMKMLDVMDYLTKHNELEMALLVKDAAKCLDLAGKKRDELIEDLRDEKKRARTLNVALGKEIRRTEKLEEQAYALGVRLYHARVRSGMGETEAMATVLRDMDTAPGKKAREAFERARKDLNIEHFAP